MWETWLFWIVIGGLIVLMFRRGGGGGHAGRGSSLEQGRHGAQDETGHEEHGNHTTRRPAHGGCH